MAESIAQLSLSAVDLLLAGKGFLQAKSKNVVAVVDSTKKSPEEILQEAGYKRGKEINDYSAKVKELQKYYTKPKPPELPQTSFPTANATSTEIVTAVNRGTLKALATVSQMSVLQSEKAALQEMVGGKIEYKEIKDNLAEDVNNWFIENIKPDYKPPYKPGTVVKEIILIRKITFVRVYDKLPKGSGLYGSWIMKAEDIEGLTPLEIRDKFSLPSIPRYKCDVELNAGVHMRMGEVNPVAGWGKGGGIQYDLMGQRVGKFKNERLLEE